MRLAGRHEFAKWDKLMRTHHDLGFRRFVGRGLRYIVERDGQWLCLAGWQTGCFKSTTRDCWIDWDRQVKWQRLHLIANNTRFAMLCEAGCYPNLGSHVLRLMCERISDDWQRQYGQGLLVVETFVDPRHHRGHMYAAGGGQQVGESAGYSRINGRYGARHDCRKHLLMRPLRRDAKRLLCRGGELAPRWQPKCRRSGLSIQQLCSLYEELSQMRDFRRGQSRKHTLASAMTVYIVSWMSGFYEPVAAAQFAASLT